MSSITKNWTEADFRKELCRLDQLVWDEQDLLLTGGELPISFIDSQKTLGCYYSKNRRFEFSLPFFNSDIPEACALDVIRHEYAHYYNDVVFNVAGGHGASFKKACKIVGAEPSTYYTKAFEEAARKKEEDEKTWYISVAKPGQKVRHPVFGVGNVMSIDCRKTTALLTIWFVRESVKIIDEKWLRENGAFE